MASAEGGGRACCGAAVASTRSEHPMPIRIPEAPGEITYATVPSALGLALVASSPAGVAAVLIGDDGDALRRDLQHRFAGHRIIEGGPAIEALATRVAAQLDTPGDPGDLPLDLRGTAFQRSVWSALRAIPPGTTATYAEVAAQLGKPQAVRAVAQACAANAHAVLIPCHRVVRSDGSLSGYRWGVERKRRLLLAERG